MADDNVILDSYFGDVNNSFYAGPNGADFHIRKVYGNLREMLADTINDSTVLIGDYFLVNYGNQNTPYDGTGNPNGRSYNRNKAIDAYDGEGYDPSAKVLNATYYTAPSSPNQTVVPQTSLPLGEKGDYFKSTSINNYWWRIYAITTVSGVLNWAVQRSGYPNDPTIDDYDDLPDAVKQVPYARLSAPGYYNATLWRRKATTSETEPEGQVNPFKYFELMFQSVSAVPNIDVATHTINAGSIPTAEIMSGSTVDSKTIDFGLPVAWDITSTYTVVNPTVSPSASISAGSGNTKTIAFTLPKAWDISVTSSSVNPTISPSVTINKQSNVTATVNFALPNIWDISASYTPVAAGISPSVTIDKSNNTTATINFALPEMWNINATVTASTLPSVTVTGETATKTFNFALPIVDSTCVNPNLVYNPCLNINTRGYEEYRGRSCPSFTLNNKTYTYTTDVYDTVHWIDNGDYTVDSWFCALMDGINLGMWTQVKPNGEDGIKLLGIASTGGVAANLFNNLEDTTGSLAGKTVTLSVTYKRDGDSNWTTKSKTGIIPDIRTENDSTESCCQIYFANRVHIDDLVASILRYKIDTQDNYKAMSNRLVVRLRAPTGNTWHFKKVKVELGSYSTIEGDMNPDLNEEYNRCIHRYNDYNQSDDYARASITPPIQVFTLTSDKISSLYDVGITYLDHAGEISYDGNTGSTTNQKGSILNFDNDPITLSNDGRVPMVCATFGELMLAGIPYEQSRIATGEKSNGELIGGTNTPLRGKSCFNIKSPILKNYWGRYTPQKQLYSSTFARLLYDSGLLHEINDLTELRPGDLLFFDGAKKSDNSTELNWRRWGTMQHVELFLGWNLEPGKTSIKMFCLSTDANATESKVWDSNKQYAKNVKVWYPSVGATLYRSTADNNTTTPDATGSKWDVSSITPGIQFRKTEIETENENIFTNPTSRLKWYVRLSAGSGGHLIPMNGTQTLKESYNATPSISLPYTWSSINANSEDDWKYIPIDDISKLIKNRVYTILIEVKSNVLNAPISWIIKGHNSGGSLSSTCSAQIECNNELFKVESNLYTSIIEIPQSSGYAFSGFAIQPKVIDDGTGTYNATLTHIWIYDKLVAP